MVSRLGVRIPRELPAARLTGLARRAEREGLDEVWIVEDCFYAGGIATASAVLAATEKITLGIGIMPAVARNPAIAAMEIAALAELYPGRLIAGFGHGVPSWMRQIDAWPKSALAAFEETLTVIRRLLAGERVSFEGKHVRLDEVELEFPPALPPKLVAGVRGPKSLAAAGRVADGTLLAEPATPEYVRATRDLIGVEGHSIATYNWLALDADPERARERARSDVASAIGPNSGPALEPLDFGAELLAEVKAATDGKDLARRLRPEWIDRLSISGPLDRCVEQIRALYAAGTESVILLPLLGEPEEESFAAAGRIASALRG
ncbi:coenzyme F420-dependent N5,N10-methenyltetrahydromethanopterin reductase [Amycolatopsis japonica]|uniref:Coenzyme F420-dependent N5,N10-methenyltetrahydromethanopterin reductase n=1 Tax=Amycolatopsis japonica TaxID=208439 RepID=A0A075V2H7_9PSEU|nr:LLM class flavin-dependent oxidoreductase [Amycolatopsis japonica]AIG79398.1 coenzyme F420-dependent N5,N10-methenyltetrahydromethanopterin reductase [Amycolatopsis japonica]